MIKALAKGAALFAFGRFPGGSKLYRLITRNLMGTQATHVDKLARVWPGYISVWKEKCGFELEGKRLWIHEGGYTLFPILAGYLLTGRGPIVTNTEGKLHDQYLERSIAAALEFDIGDSAPARERLQRIKTLSKRAMTSLEWVAELEATYIEQPDLTQLPIDENSVDLVHSGGVLEHYKPPDLTAFIEFTHRALKLGGISSHIFDHRDHLYHADKGIYFLNHLRYSELTYRVLFGHHLTYHNRLNCAKVQGVFSTIGFTEIGLRRHILPEMLYLDSAEEAIAKGKLGLAKTLLHKRYQHSEADLHTAAGHYLYRK